MKTGLLLILSCLVILLGCSKKENVIPSTPDNNSDISISAMTLPDLFQFGTIRNDSIIFSLPYGSDLSNVRTMVSAPGLEVSIANGSFVNYNQVKTLIAKSGSKEKKYSIVFNIPSKADVAVRGVWITNVASSALSSIQNISDCVDKLDDLGFNTAYVVVYNKSQTLFPSTVLKNVLNASSESDVQIYPGWDPLQTFIEKAHAKGIKVIAWFEYGFASHYAGQPSPIITLHPDWASKDNAGNITAKNSFYWLNGIHPEVQKFMLDLFSEVVQKYAVDGVQGDDRLPAMPINGGYEPYTLNLYKSETGRGTPSSDTDADWMQWRADKLTAFAGKLYHTIKNIRQNCIVAFAPTPYGWGYQNYLQAWDKWLELGYVDLISPQLYRNESQGVSSYTALIDTDLSKVLNKSVSYKSKYFPGILVRSGNYMPSNEYLYACLKYNRSKGILGESLFFYEGIENNRLVYKALYPGKAIFPF